MPIHPALWEHYFRPDTGTLDAERIIDDLQYLHTVVAAALVLYSMDTAPPLFLRTVADAKRQFDETARAFLATYPSQLMHVLSVAHSTPANGTTPPTTFEWRDTLHAAASDLRFIASGGACEPQTLQAHAEALLALVEGERAHHHAPADNAEAVPANCRQLLMRTGRPYPRSHCAGCGHLAPRSNECDRLLTATKPPTEGTPRA